MLTLFSAKCDDTKRRLCDKLIDTGRLKMREWKMRYGQNCKGGKCRSGKSRSR